jgi:2-polyprenyl-3-methyl-5-hydroxy-6-metoxy-1,4-benzoquinol methylase
MPPRASVSADSQSRRSLNGSARAVAKKLLWPARRFFDPRFVGVHEAIDDLRRIMAADANAANEAATFTGRALDTILHRVEEQGRWIEEQARALEAFRAAMDEQANSLKELERFAGFDPEAPPAIEDLDPHTAKLLNYAASHESFAAQAKLWFNPPLVVGYEPGGVALRWVNERIVEVPYAIRALSRVEPEAAVLDVGATESTLCLSLATLGYHVTAIDPRPNPLSHGRLRIVVGSIEEWNTDTTFDAVVCLSTIEHVGTGDYGQEASERRVDLEAMKRIRELTRPGGLLVLTTAVGDATGDEPGRVYDRAGLDELLEGWEVADLTLVQRRDATTWAAIDTPIEELEPDAETVAMITATKTAD